MNENNNKRTFKNRTVLTATYIPSDIEVVESESSKASVLEDLEMEDKPLSEIFDNKTKTTK